MSIPGARELAKETSALEEMPCLPPSLDYPHNSHYPNPNLQRPAEAIKLLEYVVSGLISSVQKKA